MMDNLPNSSELDHDTIFNRTSVYKYFDSIPVLGFGAFLILLSIIGIPANLISFRYFLSQTSVINQVFRIACFFDIATCIVSLPMTISFIIEKSPVVFGNKIVCRVWFIIYSITIRYSVHVVVIMSVLRTVKVFNPLSSRIKVKHVQIFMTVDLIALSLTHVFGHIGLRNNNFYCNENNHAGDFVDLRSFFPILLLIVMVVSYFLSCYKLLSNWWRLRQTGRRNTGRRRLESAITILMITAICIVVNVTYAVVSAYQRNLRVLVYVTVAGFLLSSVSNPLVYLRMSRYRDHLHRLKIKIAKQLGMISHDHVYNWEMVRYYRNDISTITTSNNMGHNCEGMVRSGSLYHSSSSMINVVLENTAALKLEPKPSKYPESDCGLERVVSARGVLSRSLPDILTVGSLTFNNNNQRRRYSWPQCSYRLREYCNTSHNWGDNSDETRKSYGLELVDNRSNDETYKIPRSLTANRCRSSSMISSDNQQKPIYKECVAIVFENGTLVTLICRDVKLRGVKRTAV